MANFSFIDNLRGESVGWLPGPLLLPVDILLKNLLLINAGHTQLILTQNVHPLQKSLKDRSTLKDTVNISERDH